MDMFIRIEKGLNAFFVIILATLFAIMVIGQISRGFKQPETDMEIYQDLQKKYPEKSPEEIEDMMFKGE